MLTNELYNGGKMGHTRKLLLERVADKLDKAEAEVERLTAACEAMMKQGEQYQERNATLEQVVEAASEFITQVKERTKTHSLDISNYHGATVQIRQGDDGKPYWQALWKYEQALAKMERRP